MLLLNLMDSRLVSAKLELYLFSLSILTTDYTDCTDFWLSTADYLVFSSLLRIWVLLLELLPFSLSILTTDYTDCTDFWLSTAD